MSNSTRFTELQTAPLSSCPTTKEIRGRAVRSPNAPRRRRFNRAVGFWLGGGLLGVGGCILGISIPYQHPVGMAVSALWWGIYLGCLGASIGAPLGLWAEQAPASSSS